ncbi:gp38 [Bacillus phage G]|uniref:Gp38 n=1 Tax=Bacillus phage G TaxID=2884420 RepID=G3MBA8_9CAUD|nr:gp38 [Bacillus phage G]AEO93309.1 gp38 [Bacillus phage G]
MKRLIKKASVYDVPEEFLFYWCSSPSDIKYNYPESIEKIANENTDCIFSGDAYRYIELPNFEYQDKEIDQLLKEAWDEVQTVEKYSSFASSKRGVEHFITTDYRSFGIIIEANVSGIDIKKLTNKYRDTVDEQVFEYADTEDEIVTLDVVDSWDIAAIVIEEEVEWIQSDI